MISHFDKIVDGRIIGKLHDYFPGNLIDDDIELTEYAFIGFYQLPWLVGLFRDRGIANLTDRLFDLVSYITDRIIKRLPCAFLVILFGSTCAVTIGLMKQRKAFFIKLGF